MSNIADFIKENCSTIGTGALVLTGPVDGSSAKFSNAWNVSTLVDYAILDGLNRETGMGTFNGSNQLSRDTVLTTLENGVYTDSGATPITLQGQAVVACALNAKAIQDVATGAVDATDVTYNSGPDFITSAAEVQNALVDHSNAIDNNTTNIASNASDIDTIETTLIEMGDSVKYSGVDVSSLSQGGVVTQDGNTSLVVQAGNGDIIDSYTDPQDPVYTAVEWNELYPELISIGGMPVVTGLGTTDIAIDPTGAVKAFPNSMDATERRENIKLCIVQYLDRVITDVINAPIMSNNVGNTLMDYLYYMGPENRIRGMVLRPTEKTVPDMSVWRDSGFFFAVGINYRDTPSNSNIRTVPATGDPQTSFTFTPVLYNNGATAIEADTQQIPNVDYEPGGAGLGTISNTNVVIHYMYQTLNNDFYLSYGQKEYSTYDDALANLFADRSSHLVPAEMSSFILLAQVVVLKSAATWGASVAEIYPINSATASGSSGGAVTQAVNISYTDTYSIGSNVQSAIDSLAGVKLTDDQNDAVDAANAPSASNPLATMVDIDGKADKIVPASAGNIATLDATGNLADGGALANNISYLASPATLDNIATLNADGSYKDSGIPITDAEETVVTDNLNSFSATEALSANQGRVLNDGKVDIASPVYVRAINPEVLSGTIRETVYNIPDANIDPTNGSIQIKDIVGPITFTTSNFEDGHYITLRLINPTEALVTWPTMRWIGGVAPTLTTEDIIVLWKENGTIFGNYTGSL